MGIWEVVGFVLICWWTVSTIVKNHKYFRALRLEGKKIFPDFRPLLSLIFLQPTVSKINKEWVEETLEKHKTQ